MKETSQEIVAVKREVQLSEWQRQIQEGQEQGRTVDEWCIILGISKGTYYHRLRKVREYMCQRMGVMEAGASEETSRSAVVPIRVAQPKEKAATGFRCLTGSGIAESKKSSSPVRTTSQDSPRQLKPYIRRPRYRTASSTSCAIQANMCRTRTSRRLWQI